MRLRDGCGWMVIVGLLIASTAQARPSVGRAGGGGPHAMNRPAPRPQMPTPRPQAMPQGRPAQLPQTRPNLPQARPQMPQTRPNLGMPGGGQFPATRPANMGPGNIGQGAGMGGMNRPQTPNFQRPSVGSMQRPNPARPSLPNAAVRPQAPAPLPGGMSRPGLGGMRPGGGATALPGNAGPQGNVGRPGLPMTKPAPQPGLPGLGGGTASRPGGGFATRPSLPQRPGQIGGGNLGGGNRPNVGPTTKPSFPTPGLPGGGAGGGNRPTTLPGTIGGNRPGGGGGDRPGLGSVNRPTTLPGDLGGNRPGGGGNRPNDSNRPGRPGIGGNRPTTLPGDLGGNRPGGGGNRPDDSNRPGRPGIGGNRPTTLPGDLGGNRPGGGGTRPNDFNRPGRPGIGGNRPTTLPGDLGNWNGGSHWNGDHHRPGIGGNRPGGSIWNSGNFSGNNLNNFNNIHVGNNVNVGGLGYGGNWGYGGGYGGWGYGGGYGGWNNGWVNPHYGNWYNGGWWAPFAAGAATWGVLSSIGSWGLGYNTLGYGAAGYVNPYYAAMPATVVASSPYDYSQPIIVNNYLPSDSAAGNPAAAPAEQAEPAAEAPSPGDAAVDAALSRFKEGDYAAALAGFDQALKFSPKDSVIHEVRALALFALGRYPEAAAALNAVLATAPGMDWTTISNVYGSVDAYTTHLRRLEDFCRSKPADAAAHFVLAYHYIVGGHSDMAAAALRVVVAQQPGDVVAKRMLEAIAPADAADAAAAGATSPPAAGKTAAEATAEQPLPEIDLVGSWRATSDTDTIDLAITADSTFRWKAQPKGKPVVELTGTIETTADAIALVSESAGTMIAKVTPKGSDTFEFSLPSAPKDTKPLLFVRQP